MKRFKLLTESFKDISIFIEKCGDPWNYYIEIHVKEQYFHLLINKINFYFLKSSFF